METKRLTRGAGILLAITSLPSSYGIGTLGDAAFQFIDLLVDLKQRYWQMLPVGPTGFGDSPYQSYSAFAGNPYLIDLDHLVKQGLLREEEIRSFHWGDDENGIDYAMIYQNRSKVLKMAYARFDREESGFRQFQEAEKDWIEDYALYMALKEQSGDREWQSWDIPLRDRYPETLEEYREKLKSEVLFYQFCQYEFFEQWGLLKEYAQSRGIKLIGDMPFYIGADSADVWANRELFLLNADGTPEGVAAAPPDAFAENGQKWGCPVYNWQRMEEDNFLWWQKRVAKQAEMCDVIKEINDYRVLIVHKIFQNNLISNKLNSAKNVQDYIDMRLLPMINKANEVNKCIIKIINLYREDLRDYKKQVGIKIK